MRIATERQPSPCDRGGGVDAWSLCLDTRDDANVTATHTQFRDCYPAKPRRTRTRRVLDSPRAEISLRNVVGRQLAADERRGMNAVRCSGCRRRPSWRPHINQFRVHLLRSSAFIRGQLPARNAGSRSVPGSHPLAASRPKAVLKRARAGRPELHRAAVGSPDPVFRAGPSRGTTRNGTTAGTERPGSLLRVEANAVAGRGPPRG